MIPNLFSFLLCPLTFASARITTVWFLLLGILGWGKRLINKEPLTFPFLSVRALGLLFIFFYSPRLSLYVLCGLGISFLPLRNVRYLTYGILATLILLLMDTYCLLPQFSRYGARLHTVPCLTIAIMIWICFEDLIQNKRYLSFFGLFGITFWTLKRCDCDTAFLTFILASCSFIFSKIPHIARNLSFSYLGFFLLPFFFFFQNSDIENLNKSKIHEFSYIHRLYIIKDVCDTIRHSSIKEFLFGHGINASRKTLKRKPLWTFYEKDNQKTLMPGGYFHPHNIPLQIWLDLGLLGVLIFCVLFAKIHFYRFSHIGWMMSVCCISLLSVGLFEWWWLGLFFISHRFYFQNQQLSV